MTVETDDNKQADLDFATGFTQDAPTDATAPAAEPKPTAKPAPKAEAKTEAKVEAKVEAKPSAPKYVQITQDQLDSLQAAAGKTASIEAQLSKVFGTMGDMQQVVRKLQAATPAGMSIEIPNDAFAEMEKDFPELATRMRDALEKVLKNVRGTAPSSAEPDPEAVGKLVDSKAIKREIEALDDVHPTWRAIVGAVDATGQHDPNNPFRKWLATQETAYQTKINATNSAAVISRALDKFIADTKPASKVEPKSAPKIAARVDRIRAAIQPKGDGGQPPAPKTADDDFNAGFQQEYRGAVG